MTFEDVLEELDRLVIDAMGLQARLSDLRRRVEQVVTEAAPEPRCATCSHPQRFHEVPHRPLPPGQAFCIYPGCPCGGWVAP